MSESMYCIQIRKVLYLLYKSTETVTSYTKNKQDLVNYASYNLAMIYNEQNISCRLYLNSTTVICLFGAGLPQSNHRRITTCKPILDR